MGTLPRDAPRPRKRRVDFSDDSTDGQAAAVQSIVMEPEVAPTPFCAIHVRAQARGLCERCSNPACEICLSRGGVCPACRRERAPEFIARTSKQLGVVSAVAAAMLIAFVLYRYLDKTVLDVDSRRSALALILALVHVLTGAAVALRRSFALAVVATGAVLLGVLVPLLGAEPWWMAFFRVGAASWCAVATLRIKRQMDELYLSLDRAE
jgi:hypothetical protein